MGTIREKHPDIPHEAKRAPNKAWLRLITIALTVLFLAAIFWRIPFRNFWTALGAARILPFLLLTGVFNLVWCLTDTFILTKMVQWFHGPVRFSELLPVRATSYLFSVINMQLAQGAMALYINRRFRTPLGEISSTVVMLVLLEVTKLICFAAAGFVAFPGGVPPVFLAAAVGTALAWCGLLGLAGGESTLGRVAAGIPLLHTFRRATSAQVLSILGLKGGLFLLSVLVHHQALRFFGIEIPLGALLAFLPVVYFVIALPITVAHLGTAQAAWIFLFGSYAPAADLLAYSLAYQASFVLAQVVLGLIFLPRAYQDLFGRARADRPAVATTP